MWMLLGVRHARWRIRNNSSTSGEVVPPKEGCPAAAEVKVLQSPLLECSGTAPPSEF
jgi:hypothetical protein